MTTSPTLITSLKDYQVVMRQLSVGESLEIAHYGRRNHKFLTIREFLNVSSNLGEEELKLISLQDAIALVVYYRMNFWNEVKLSSDVELKASDFIRAMPQPILKYVDFETNEEATLRCYTEVKLDLAISAYNECVYKGDLDKFGIYLMGASSSIGAKIGANILLNLPLDTDIQGKMTDWVLGFSSHSQVKLTIEDTKDILMISNPKGADSYSLPFLGIISFSL